MKTKKEQSISQNRLANQIQLATDEMVSIGIRFDMAKSNEMFASLEQEKAILFSKIQPVVLAHMGKSINLNANKDVATLIYDKLGYEVKYHTETMARSTNAEALKATNDSVAIMIAEWRSIDRDLKKILELQSFVQTDGRIHANFNPFGASNGRYTCDKPNLQNVSERLRCLFIPEDGFDLLSLDMKQAEYRVSAALAGEDDLLRAFAEGADVHDLMAERLHITRDKAKLLNHAIGYGMTPFGVAREIGVSEEQGSFIIEEYYKVRQKLLIFQNKVRQLARERGFIATLDGTVRTFDFQSAAKIGSGAVEDLANKAFATLVSGTAADLIKRAHLRLNAIIQEKNLPVRIVLNLHDELLLEVPENNPDIVTELEKVFSASPEDFVLPLAATITLGKTWPLKD